MKHDIQRRRLLKGMAALGASGALFNLPRLAQASGGFDTSGHKALVCINLAGGNDASNLIVPNSDAGYAAYSVLRSSMALKREELLPIDPAGEASGAYALHPKLSGLQSLFQSGRMAVVANVGTMTAPVSKYHRDGRPPKISNHASQQLMWQGTDPRRLSIEKNGWMGRLMDAEPDLLSASTSGSSLWQTGRQEGSTPQVLSGAGARRYNGRDDAALAAVFDELDAQGMLADHPLESEYAVAQQGAIGTADSLHQALNNAEIKGLMAGLSVPFPNSGLGKQLSVITRLLLARDVLGQPRRTFYARQGGYDTHKGQLGRHNRLYAQLDAALYAFQSALDELGLSGEVTTFTLSEFGRTYTSNGSGTDHGWGGHAMVMGGAVNGGQIYGRMPEIDLNGPDLSNGKGVLVPSTSAEQYSATLARWFGASEGLLSAAFPYLDNFAERDLGFMSA